MTVLGYLDWSPLFISLKTAFVTIIIVSILGVLAAWRVIRLKNKTLKLWVDGCLTLPLVLPPTVTGFLLLCLLGNNSLIGSYFVNKLGINIAFSWPATVITASVISFPLMYRCAKASLEQVDKGLWLAGKSLGMSEWHIFYRIILPNAIPGLLAGGSLTFARALGEFGATTMLAGNIIGKTRTLPQAIYSETISGDMLRAGWYTFIIVIICLATVISINWYIYKRHNLKERKD